MKHQLSKIWKKVIISDLATISAYSCSEMSKITKPQATEQSASRDPSFKCPNTSYKTSGNRAKCQPRSKPQMPKYKLQNLRHQSKVPAEIQTSNAQIQVTKPQATEQSASRDPNLKCPNTSFHHTVLHYLLVLLVKIIISKYTVQSCRRAYPDSHAEYGVGLLSLACWVCMSLLWELALSGRVSASCRSLVRRSPYRIGCVRMCSWSVDN
jgi:hypothetical protein